MASSQWPFKLKEPHEFTLGWAPADFFIYWEFISVDTFGKALLKNPKRVSGWVENKQEKFVTEDNQEVLSHSIVLTAVPLKKGSYIYIDDTNSSSFVNDPATLPGARMIHKIDFIKGNYYSDQKLVKAYLR